MKEKVNGNVGGLQWKKEREVAMQLYGWFELTHSINTLPQQKQRRATLGRKKITTFSCHGLVNEN